MCHNGSLFPWRFQVAAAVAEGGPSPFFAFVDGVASEAARAERARAAAVAAAEAEAAEAAAESEDMEALAAAEFGAAAVV